jgi:hypothetical protein
MKGGEVKKGWSEWKKVGKRKEEGGASKQKIGCKYPAIVRPDIRSLQASPLEFFITEHPPLL